MIIKLHRYRFSFGLQINRRIYLLQFSTKEPWLIPKRDKHYGENNDIVLYGWMFVYFGYTNLMRE